MKTTLLPKIGFCLLLAAATLKNFAGVTLITHGFNSDIDDWIKAMAGAVTQHPMVEPDSPCYEIFLEQNRFGIYEPKLRKLRGGDPKSPQANEIIIKLNWSEFAGNLLDLLPLLPLPSTTNLAPAVAWALTSPSFMPELGGRALAELPLHLVGHSRGGSLVCEITKSLGREGIWVDHLTTLDPHPLNNEYDDTLVSLTVDGLAVPYINVFFADNYYQVNDSVFGNDPSGQYVIGAYNRLLNVRVGGYVGFARYHANTHLWYHGTIDLETPSSDSKATLTSLERRDWWTAAEASGASAGFHYSLIGGGNRLSEEAPAGGNNRVKDGMNQIWDFGAGGSANRFALPENFGLWPNLLTLNATATNLTALSYGRKGFTIEAGETFPLSLKHQYGQAQSTNLILHVFLDEDLNPYSSNETWLQTVRLNATGTSMLGNVTTAISGSGKVRPDFYAIGAAITDGIRTRYLYAPEFVRVKPSSQPPQMTLASRGAGVMEVRVAGGIGQKVLIEASADLVNWIPVETNTLSNPTWNYMNSVRPSEKMRIFRARTAP